MVERRPEEPRVGGSIPSPGTTVIPVILCLPSISSRARSSPIVSPVTAPRVFHIGGPNQATNGSHATTYRLDLLRCAKVARGDRSGRVFTG